MSDTKLFNKSVKWWKENISSDPRYTAYQAALEPVRKEFESFLLGGRALYGDRKAAETILSDESTPAMVSDALKQMGHTVQARYTELDHRFQNQMGVPIREAIGDLSPEAKVGAQKIGIQIGGGAQAGGGGEKSYTQADVDAAVAAHKGLTQNKPRPRSRKRAGTSDNKWPTKSQTARRDSIQMSL